MRRLLMTALATAAFALSSTAAFAAVELKQQTGPDLATKIYASGDAGVATLNQPVVYGNTSPGAGHNVAFSGYTGFNSGTLALTAPTNISITGGNGFAAISDANYTNPTGNNPSPSTNDLFAVLINPTQDFYLYEFSLLQSAAGSVSVYYDLAGGGTDFLQATGTYLNGNGDTQYIFGDASNPSLAVDKLLIVSGTAINQLKQNSLQLTGAMSAVPEPATWAMMLIGFGAMGASLRRSRRRSGKMLQIA